MVEVRTVEDFKIGESAQIQHTISVEDLNKFAELSGDYNPLHLDSHFAKNTVYKKPVVHGMLTAAFISQLIGQKIPGPGALWFEQHMKFLLPVYINDTIHITATITHISVAQQVLVLNILVTNQFNRIVLSGEGKVKMIHEEDAISTQTLQKSAIIISGGASGIGAAIAVALSSAGYPIVINYHQRRSEAEKLAAEINQNSGRAIAVRADLTDFSQVKSLVATTLEVYKTLQGYIHCAAPPIIQKSILEMQWEDMQIQLDVQLKGSFHLSQAVLPILIKNQYGNIINIISTVIDTIPPDKWSAYVLAKSALLSFTKSLAAEYGPHGIRINAISPGITLTNLIADLSERAKMVAKLQAPLRRLANPEDIAQVVKFLISCESSHITGQNIRVCGGSIMA